MYDPEENSIVKPNLMKYVIYLTETNVICISRDFCFRKNCAIPNPSQS